MDSVYSRHGSTGVCRHLVGDKDGYVVLYTIHKNSTPNVTLAKTTFLAIPFDNSRYNTMFMASRNQPSAIFCSLDNIWASFCCRSASSPRPLKSTRNKAMMESIIWISINTWRLLAFSVHLLESHCSCVYTIKCLPVIWTLHVLRKTWLPQNRAVQTDVHLN